MEVEMLAVDSFVKLVFIIAICYSVALGILMQIVTKLRRDVAICKASLQIIRRQLNE